MSEEKKPAAGGHDEKPKGGGFKITLQAVLVGLNLLTGLGVLGFAAYSKLAFERPQITEEKERESLKMIFESPKAIKAIGSYQFPVVTVNIESQPEKGQYRFITYGLSFEVRDEGRLEELVNLKPKLMDKVLSMLAQKTFQELNNVQGRFVLRQEILDVANQMLGDELVLNVYFHQFVVQ